VSVAASLERLPAVCTTGVGSLPFRDPDVAVQHLWRAYDIPFCPQLPALEGDMLAEWLGGVPGRCGWTPERERARPAAWGAFIDGIRRRPPRHGLVKLQATGPITLARGLGVARDDPELFPLACDLAAWVACVVRGWVAEVADLGLVSLVVVDEPSIGDLTDLGALEAWASLRASAPLFGLHVCGEVPWALVFAADPDVVSFDLSRWRGEPSLGSILERGIVPVVGIHPVAPTRLPSVAALEKAARLERCIITPACGTGLATQGRERELAALVRAIARRRGRVVQRARSRSR
jgi:hypothetical protein